MTIIGLKELRQNATQIAERAQKGERFTVLKRSKPVFDIVPTSQKSSSVQETVEWTEKFVEEYRPVFEALSKR